MFSFRGFGCFQGIAPVARVAFVSFVSTNWSVNGIFSMSTQPPFRTIRKTINVKAQHELAKKGPWSTCSLRPIRIPKDSRAAFRQRSAWLARYLQRFPPPSVRRKNSPSGGDGGPYEVEHRVQATCPPNVSVNDTVVLPPIQLRKLSLLYHLKNFPIDRFSASSSNEFYFQSPSYFGLTIYLQNCTVM